MPFHVPLNSEAIAVLEVVRAQPRHIKHREVFLYRGQPVKGIRTAFMAACKKIGLEGVTFHTFRHTYASWLVQYEVPLRMLQELGGWKRADMVHRYAHLTSEDLQAYQERLALGHKNDTNPKIVARNNIH